MLCVVLCSHSLLLLLFDSYFVSLPSSRVSVEEGLSTRVLQALNRDMALLEQLQVGLLHHPTPNNNNNNNNNDSTTSGTSRRLVRTTCVAGCSGACGAPTRTAYRAFSSSCALAPPPPMASCARFRLSFRRCVAALNVVVVVVVGGGVVND
jgi:hypothetical protein